MLARGLLVVKEALMPNPELDPELAELMKLEAAERGEQDSGRG